MKSTKKILAILMAAVLVLGLAACSKAPANDENPAAGGNSEFEDPQMMGMLVFATEAAVSINYDNQGLVLGMESINAEGAVLAEAFPDVVGKTCNDLVGLLVAEAAKNAMVTENTILKLSYGSAAPSETFLEQLATDAKAAADAANAVTSVITISTEQLDENGYIGVDSIKAIMLGKLGLTSMNTFSCESSPDTNANFLVYLEGGEVKGSFHVNGITGVVAELSEEDLAILEGNIGEEEIPEEETNFDNLPTEEATGTTESEQTPTEGATEATEPADATEATEAA